MRNLQKCSSRMKLFVFRKTVEFMLTCNDEQNIYEYKTKKQ